MFTNSIKKRLSAMQFAVAFVIFGILVSLGDGLPMSWARDRKKIVSFAWEWRYHTAKDYVRYADKIGETGLDGIGIYISASGHDGEEDWMSHRLSDGKILWTRDMVADQAGDFKKATMHKGLRECFIRSFGAPRSRIDWRDDIAWNRIAKSMGTLAWLAKEGGIKGLAMDPEDYGRSNQFKRRHGDPSWKELVLLARKRGREIFSEVFRVYPDVVILSLWLFSWDIADVRSNNPALSARITGNLWPAFVNGILDVLPPTALLVDGNEWAYQIEASRQEFAASANAQRDAVYGIVAPENRSKYRGQVLPGFGLYLDSFTGAVTNGMGKPNPYYFGAENGSRLGHFERNLSAAIANCGGYVWLWGEQYCWINHDSNQRMLTAVNRELWAEKLPGINSVLRATVNPDEFLIRDFPLLRNAGRMKNLLSDKDPVKLSKTAVLESGRRRIRVNLPESKVQPGTHYVVSAGGYGDGLSAEVWWGVRLPSARLAIDGPAEGRRLGAFVVAVPEGAKGLFITFSMPPETEGKCYFDEFYLGEIPR